MLSFRLLLFSSSVISLGKDPKINLIKRYRKGALTYIKTISRAAFSNVPMELLAWLAARRESSMAYLRRRGRV